MLLEGYQSYGCTLVFDVQSYRFVYQRLSIFLVPKPLIFLLIPKAAFLGFLWFDA